MRLTVYNHLDLECSLGTQESKSVVKLPQKLVHLTINCSFSNNLFKLLLKKFLQYIKKTIKFATVKKQVHNIIYV